MGDSSDLSLGRILPMCISEHGTIGPQGMALLDDLFARAACPTAAKTYWMRRLHVTTARRIHAIMHTQLRGYDTPTTPATPPDDEAVQTQTCDANAWDDAGAASPRAVLPTVGQGQATPATTALRGAVVHDDDDIGHMWLDNGHAGEGGQDGRMDTSEAHDEASCNT